MKKSKLQVGVFLALIVTCSTMSAQEPQLRVSNGVLLNLAEEKADRLQVSSEARRDLAITAQSVISRRIGANLLGYEQSAEYLGGLNAVYEGFSSALDRGLGSSAFDSPDFRDSSLSALTMNEAEFEAFYSRVLSKDPVLQGKSSSEIKEAMLLFSATIYQSDRPLWNSARRRSYFWPVCLKARD